MAFWKKIFKSKYTGAEIDAAVAKAGTVPAVTEADAGKALVVDSEGKIVAGEAGGGDVFVIKGTCNLEADTPTITITTPSADIEAAFNNNKFLVLHLVDIEGNKRELLYDNGYIDEFDGLTLSFTSPTAYYQETGYVTMVMLYAYLNAGVWSIEFKTINVTSYSS